MAPDSLILAFELGTNARPGAMVQKITSWSDFKQVLRQLEKPEVKERFSVICLDTCSIAYDLCEQYICNQAGVQKISDIPYGAGYKNLSKEYESALRKITMLGYGEILTCHLKELKDDEGRIIGYKPDLNDRCYSIVNGLVDIIAVITQTWDNKGESHRWIQTRSTPTIKAGSRYQYLDACIPFGYNEFVDALGRAIDKEQENGATVVDSIKYAPEEKLDFFTIRKEANELWNKLITSAEDKDDMINILMKKIEIVFGRKLKLSEVTEDQVELFNDVLIEMRELANNL